MDSQIDQFITNSPEETYNIGQWAASKITTSAAWNKDKPNFVIALFGELGSGKTCLTKGIAEGFGIADCITSPTYMIITEYPILKNNVSLSRMQQINFLTFYHIDAYRLNDEKEFEDIGGREILSSNGICVIEWSEKIKKLLPPDAIKIYIEFLSADSRKITIEGIK